MTEAQLTALDALYALAEDRAAWPADHEAADQQAREAAEAATAGLVDALVADPDLFARIKERVVRRRAAFEALPHEITVGHRMWVGYGAYARKRRPNPRATPHLPSTVNGVVARRLEDARLEMARREAGFVCDCRALVKLSLLGRFPKSDRMETVRDHDDGYFRGVIKRCGHCDALWFYYFSDDALGTPTCGPYRG